jgi:Uncharacterized protein conserved in bacteria (DUF2087)
MSPLASTLLNQLAPLVVKDGLSLAGLTPGERSLTLALACTRVPAGVALREADVNAALKAALGDECRCIGVDHVELRRWLVDTGWLVRDGFGREYRRVAFEALRPELQPLAAALASVDAPAWVAQRRSAEQARREQRRADWLARAGKAAA